MTLLLAQLAFVVTGFFVVGARRTSPALLAVYAASQVVFIAAFSGLLPLAIATHLDQVLIAVALVAFSRRGNSCGINRI